jgi:hypothetical protein
MPIPSKPTLDFIDEVVKTAAVCVAGAWTYVNYARGRTHRRRLEIEITGSLSELDGVQKFFGDCIAKNIGLSKAPIAKEGTGISIFALRLATRPNGTLRIAKEEVVVLPVFTSHGWIEPGETISEPITVLLPNAEQPLLGARIEVMISNGTITWNASKVFERTPKQEVQPNATTTATPTAAATGAATG